MTKPDWEGAYHELEAAHIELWRWANIFCVGLRAGGRDEIAHEIGRRFGVDRMDNPFSPWNTVQAIRRLRLGLEDGGDSYCAQCQRPHERAI